MIEIMDSTDSDSDSHMDFTRSGTSGSRMNTSSLLSDIASSLPNFARSSWYQKKALGRAYQKPLDRVNVLGNDTYGHTGCVNALSWAQNGEILISGGDDTTVRLWRLDRNETSTPYPYKCDTVIHTGHRGNIFNAHMLPSSSRIVTVAGDRQVRVFNVEKAMSVPSQGREIEFSTERTCIRVLKCHSGRTKRIVTEESDDQFLTVGEDGAVRQHDLRTHHRCSSSTCPRPLVKLPHDLSTLTLSPLTPYHFVVAGEAPHGYLFDRRQTGRILKAEWGMACDSSDYTTCVRRFGRTARGPGEMAGCEHVTGARMAQNGHEVLLSYSGDAVYLYSTRDDPQTPAGAYKSAVLAPNAKRRKLVARHAAVSVSDRLSFNDVGDTDPSESAALAADESEEEVETETEDERPEDQVDEKFRAPIILPRTRYVGAGNVETVKDVNFVGPDDEYVTSGSDDGNFFLWEKKRGRLHGIYEGDSSVVNVIESHPRLPLLAVSGIDTTVKLFSLSNGPSRYALMHNAENIIATNVNSSNHSARRRLGGFASLYLHYRLAMREASVHNGEDNDPQCTYQ